MNGWQLATTSLVPVLALYLLFVENWIYPLVGLIGIGTVTTGITLVVGTIVFVVLFAVVLFGSNVSSDGDEDPILPAVSSAIRAGALAAFVYLVWTNFAIETLIRNGVVLVPVIVFAWFVYVYLQNRRNVARTSTAVDRTRRDVSNSVENWTEVLFGAFVVAFAAGAAVFSGVFSASGGIGEVLLDFPGEIAFLIVTTIGFDQLGGEFLGAGVIPELNHIQWLGVTLTIGAVALVVRDV